MVGITLGGITLDIRKVIEAKEYKGGVDRETLNGPNLDFRIGVSIGMGKLGKIHPALSRLSVKRGKRTSLKVLNMNKWGNRIRFAQFALDSTPQSHEIVRRNMVYGLR